MRYSVGDCVLELTQGDVTEQDVDAVVNAANSRLAGGGGVDGAIHRRGGPSIMAETDRRYPQGCPTGSAVISQAGDLPAKYIFHAVGPIWSGGERGEPQLLESAYRRCLELAVENDCRSLAFPSLSTGAYRYPLDLAARIAVSAALDFLSANQRPTLVRFVLFNAEALNAFSAALKEITAK